MPPLRDIFKPQFHFQLRNPGLVSKNCAWGKLANVSGHVEDEIGQIEVPAVRLDTVVSRDSLPLPNVIKIDVEGAEGAVLDGAVETITRSRPLLIIELHGTNAAVADKLKALGYFPVVPGGTTAIMEAHWNAQVVAFPAPCLELTRLQDENWVGQ